MYFVNTTGEKFRCGVRNLGLSIYEAIKSLGFIYTEDLENLSKNSLYIFNWHPSTNTGRISRDWLANLGGKSIGLLHDPYNNPDFFDIKARLDPNFKESAPFYNLPRIIKDYDFPEVNRDKIIISSWGYGLGHKNYELVVNKVEKEIKDAIIRLHIPFSDWCDPDGQQAMEISKRCQNLVRNNKIQITHEYLGTYDFLKWANQSTINMFACDESVIGGVSSCVDSALMAKRPILVNKCIMYNSIYSKFTSIDDNLIMDIVTNNTENRVYLDSCSKEWTEEKFRRKIECLIEKLAH